MRLQRPQGVLSDSLARIGLSPADIHLVIDTHLHGDHAGGNTHYGDDGQSIIPAFPNAEYVVQRREYEDAMHPNERTRATYFPINYQPLVESGQMRLLDGDTELMTWCLWRGHARSHPRSYECSPGKCRTAFTIRLRYGKLCHPF